MNITFLLAEQIANIFAFYLERPCSTHLPLRPRKVRFDFYFPLPWSFLKFTSPIGFDIHEQN